MEFMDNIGTSLVDWSRAQFALTAIYHWIFVPLTLGMALVMAIMETIYYRTKDDFWKQTAKFWQMLFGINFAVGVATGLILEFEFGTNWSNYSWFVGDIFGAPLAIEGIVAFFMEATCRSNSTRTIPFNISALQKEKYNYAEAISISAFSRELEKLLPENMKGVSYKSMTIWLMQQGLLVESEPDIKGRIYKMATAKGNEIGISTEQREREDGGYLATLYNREAQKYLLDHIEEISLVQE